MRRKKGFDKGLLIVLFIVLVVGATGVLLVFKLRTDKITESLQSGTPVTVAFFITDREELLFSEILFYHPLTHKASILDMPGEVGSIIKSLQKIERIDVLFSPSKPELFLGKIGELIGQEVPYYIILDLGNLEAVVDILEGLEMFIANPVEYVDEDTTILLPSGSVILDGSKVTTYITYEISEVETELDKISRKQKFLQALVKEIGEKNSYLTDDHVFPLFRSRLDTNLDKNSLISLILELSKLDTERIVFQRVLGVERKVDENILLFPHYDGRLLKETVSQTMESLANTELLAEDDLTVSLRILNGTDRNGLAGRTSQIYKSFGFDVISVGNADQGTYDKTVVIDRTGDITKAQKVANVIGCSNIQSVQALVDTESFFSEDEIETDVIIVLGKDFDGRYCK